MLVCFICALFQTGKTKQTNQTKTNKNQQTPNLILRKQANCKLFCKQWKIKVMNIKRPIQINAFLGAVTSAALFPGESFILEI